MTAIAWIGDEASGADAASLGGKGSGLSFLASHGVPIPPAFVVTAEGYRHAIDPEVRAQVVERTANLRAGASEEEVAAVAGEIRSLIRDATTHHPLRAELQAAYERLAEITGEEDVSVAVRSSSVAEDGASSSFAGEHDTYLWVMGLDDVEARVHDCWASLATVRAVAYRHRMAGAANDELAMAVVVQQMAPARAAGVFMTLNPTNGDRSKIMIESVWGLGEPLVSGEANPDRFLVDKVTGEIVRRDIVDKPTEAVRNPDSKRGVVARAVPDDRRTRPSLEIVEITEIVRVARLVERVGGGPQDGEFAVVDSDTGPDVRFVQCRPETAWSQRPKKVVTGRRTAMEAVLATLTKGSGDAVA